MSNVKSRDAVMENDISVNEELDIMNAEKCILHGKIGINPRCTYRGCKNYKYWGWYDKYTHPSGCKCYKSIYPDIFVRSEA